MSSEIVNLKATGLYTFFQSLMEVPPGALLQANNAVIDRDGVVERRRGLKQYSSSNLTPAKQLLEYKSTLLTHIGDKLAYDNGSGSFTNFQGSFDEPTSGYRIKYLEAKSNLYFTTSNGVKKLSAKSSADFLTDSSSNPLIEDIGGPKAIAGVLTLSGDVGVNGNVSFLQNGETINYRILWIYTDKNDNLIFGAPSALMSITNSSGSSKNVSLTFPVPYDVREGYRYRIYRSEASPSGIPSDELFQVYEGTVTTPVPTSITLIEDLDQNLLTSGVPLYTNQNSGEGILKSNEPPPAAKDIALFKGHMFFANTRTRHALSIQLKTNTGLSGKKITIGSNQYTFTVGASIEETAKNLVNSINLNSSEILTAYYLSTTGDQPGKIYLQRKDLVDTIFSVISDAPINSFSPDLTVSNSSITEKVGNRIYWSKYQEHEAVPLLNYSDVGSKDQEIKRIVALRESIFIFKEDGVFRLAGDPGANPFWDISVFDNTSIIKAPDSVTTLGNQCYFFSNQGVMRLNESSIEPISTPIKNKIIPFITTNPNIGTLSFSINYESDNSLLFFTCLNKTDTKATVCYRYNTKTQAWTEWKMTKTCGIVPRFSDKLYLGSGISPEYYIEVERKNFNRFDYADYELISAVPSQSLTGNILKPANFSILKIGDVLTQVQNVTIYQFNSLLKKLDLDPELPYNNFYQELKMNYGDSLTSKMALLVSRLTAVDNSAVYTFSGTSVFSQIQTEFNTIITTLNTVSTKTSLKNYKQSSGTVSQEAIILGIDILNREVTLHVEPSFMVGDLVVYKGIPTEIEYAPQHAGDPAAFKQFSSGTFMFERRSFYTAEAAYNSDISDNFEKISFVAKTSGIFGGAKWGSDSTWGGSGDQGELRTLIPLKKQRCRFLGCKFTHLVALETFQLYGLSLSVRIYTISDRDYR